MDGGKLVSWALAGGEPTTLITGTDHVMYVAR